jgi:hypothetical protein
MFYWLYLAIELSGTYPLWRAWRANRLTALSHTVHWTIAAWLGHAWGLTALARGSSHAAEIRYLALCLTACAATAALGARRPGVVAFNFVVIGLLLVTLLPLAEPLYRGGRFRLDGYRAVVVSSVLAMGVLNYLPTRLGGAAIFVGSGTCLQVASLLQSSPPPGNPAALAGHVLVALAPWVGLVSLQRLAAPSGEFDRLWFDFRDRFGMVWSQRLREQFNRAAVRNGWRVILYWNGLRMMAGGPPLKLEELSAILSTLTALMKRFMEPSGDEPRTP